MRMTRLNGIKKLKAKITMKRKLTMNLKAKITVIKSRI